MAAYLPDVFLLSVFRRVDAHDRLSASQVCPNWCHRVREVNQALRSLTLLIGDESFIESFSDNLINQYTYGYSPMVKLQLLKDTEMEMLERRKIYCSTKWNTLHFSSIASAGLQLNSRIVRQIITAFPATTELNFFNSSNSIPQYDYLAQMLESDQTKGENSWSQQLTTLRVIDLKRVPVAEATNKRLFTAINGLPALRKLAFSLTSNNENGLQMMDLPVLARLAEVRMSQGKDGHLAELLNSIQQFAAENAHLQIDLPNGLEVLKDHLLSADEEKNSFPLNRQIREQVVRVTGFINSLPDLQSTCISFPHLTSLSIECTSRAEYATMFTLISQNLLHLLHLEMYIDFRQTTANEVLIQEDADDEGDAGNVANRAIPQPLSSALPSVKVLQLSVTLTSHADLQWLNLSATMPSLQAVHFSVYSCAKCDVHSCSYDGKIPLSQRQEEQEQQATWQCFQAVLSQLVQQTPLPPERITFNVGLTGSVVSGLGVAVL